jgi:hypothetical protein
VTGVQTCALPIYPRGKELSEGQRKYGRVEKCIQNFNGKT